MDKSQGAAGSLTSEEYWSEVWEQTSTRPVCPKHHYDRDVLKLFRQAAELLGTDSIKVLEVATVLIVKC